MFPFHVGQMIKMSDAVEPASHPDEVDFTAEEGGPQNTEKVPESSSGTLMGMKSRIEDPKFQRRLALIIASAALLLDNMLYMVIVPIIPDYLRNVSDWEVKASYSQKSEFKNEQWVNSTYVTDIYYENEGPNLTFLFASKAFIQLILNPMSGSLIDRVGYKYPMMFGLFVMFVSTTLFAFGESYLLLFMARCMQGIGSAFADTAGLGNLIIWIRYLLFDTV